MSGRSYLLTVGIVMLLFYELPAYLIYGPSSSMPKGWYLRVAMHHPVQRGDIVVLTPPAVLKAAMPVGLPHDRLLKMVGAIPGDTACWEDTGMAVIHDGHENYYPFAPTHPPRTHPLGCQVLSEGELVIVAPHARSYDSRHVGPIPQCLVQFRVVPLWTWKGGE
jgi:type IV secretory pathway protease TraF